MLDYITNTKHKTYEKIEFIGEGSFGIVFKAKDLRTNQIVAIKKIKLGPVSSSDGYGRDEGVSFSAIREIKTLQEVKHSNILNLLDVYVHKKNIHLVFEYCDLGDLEQVIKDRSLILQEGDIKQYMKMILEAVAHCHQHWILHRDLKPSNLFLSRNEETQEVELKLADFGLAKVFGSPEKRYSPMCVTRWYRSPELLFGAELYGPSVDIWSIGCIFAELMLRAPLLPGDSDLDQLGKIFACLGTPTDEEWPGMRLLPNFIEFEPYQRTEFSALFTAASRDALDLISKMLLFDPSKRITVQDALKHPFFTRGVQPTPKDKLPTPKKMSAKDSYQHYLTNHDEQEQRDHESHMRMNNKNIYGKVLNFEDVSEETETTSTYSIFSSVNMSFNSSSSAQNTSLLSDDVMGEVEGSLSTPISQKRSLNESGVLSDENFLSPMSTTSSAKKSTEKERSIRRKLDL